MNNIDRKKLIDSALAASNGKLDRDTINKAARSGNTDALLNALSEDDRKKLNDILSNKNALAELLKSPQAAAILKSLYGGKKNG